MTGAAAMMQLTRRWTELRFHAEQQRLWHSPARFKTVPAGRRSGKTELSKRKLVKCALRGTKFDNARFFAAAPTYGQAKRIFWDDLKALVPKHLMAGRPSESELVISTIMGSEIHVIGMDKPERIEGSPWDGGVITEMANMKANAWPMNVRPALADREGWCILEGVPEGRNHYYELDNKAKADETGEWDSFHWKSAEILSPSEIDAARRDLDPLSFEQEYEASFLNFAGRAYYPFDARKHCRPLRYDPLQPLIFCFDFNVAPGVAVVIQEQHMPGQFEVDASGKMTTRPIIGSGVIGEVHIPVNSNTPAVCAKLIQDWGQHKGRVVCYGDATGGARGTAKVAGSDWDLIKTSLRGHFKERVFFRNGLENPPERTRVNAVNTRLLNGVGEIHLMVDPAKAPNVIKDFEGVALLAGGSGEIDKQKTPNLTHLTDGIGYYVAEEFPISGPSITKARVTGA